MRKYIPLAILSIVILCSLVVSVYGQQTFTVPALSKTTQTLNLSAGDSVSGSLSVLGGSGNDINFQVTDPMGNTLVSYYRVTGTSFSFSASMTGTYTMTFDNSFSLISSKSVTLNYSVQPAIAGVPQNTFLLLIGAIAVILIIIVVIVVAVSRHSHPRQSILNPQAAQNRSALFEKPKSRNYQFLYKLWNSTSG